jgi:hypothetical protein
MPSKSPRLRIVRINLAADYVPRTAESANRLRRAFCYFRAASDKLNGDSFFFGNNFGSVFDGT